MHWQQNDTALATHLLEKLSSESSWAARWCFLAWGTLSAFLALLLIGHVFSARTAIVIAIPFAFIAALLHVIAMSELGSVYWRSRKAQRAFSEYCDSALHSRAKRGAALAFISQNCAFLAFPLAQFALLAPSLWVPALAMSAVSLSVARYAGRTSELIVCFKEASKNTGAVWL